MGGGRRGWMSQESKGSREWAKYRRRSMDTNNCALLDDLVHHQSNHLIWHFQKATSLPLRLSHWVRVRAMIEGLKLNHRICR